MIGYVSFEEEKATKHFDSIKSLFESGRFLQDYPHCAPKIQVLRNSAKQWSRKAIVTASDAMIVPLSLQGSSRGWKSPTGRRFDVIVLDDIDKLGMSVDLIKKLLELLKGEILAAGDDNTLVVVPQNLVHRDSIVSRIFDGRADILSDRIFHGPFPLLKWYDAEKIAVPGDTNGAMQWVITAGEAYDPAIDISYAQKLLNKFGKDTFDRECQQEVYKVGDEKDFREWDEIYHVITYSEFRQYFESLNVPVWSEERDHPQIPHNWNVGLGLDWGTTAAHPSAVAAFARPHQLSPLADCFFSFTEVILPTFPMAVGEDVPLVSPGRVSAAIKQAMKEWNVSDGQIRKQLMSHEASAALNTMLIDLPEDLKSYFRKWVPKRGSGVPQIQNLLEIDRKQPHPFRPELKGRPRLYFVVPDDQGKLLTGELGKLYVAQPRDYKGLARARYEIPLYSHLNGGQKKIDDDWVDGALGIMNVFGVSSAKPSREEYINSKLPEELRPQAIAAEENPHRKEQLHYGQVIERAKIEKQINRQQAGKSKNAFDRMNWK
jgi:hypothetical protein